MFITFELYEKLLNENKVITPYSSCDTGVRIKKDLMDTYNITTEEGLVPLLLDFEINRIVNIFRNKNMDFLRTFYAVNQSVETAFVILGIESGNCLDMIICGLFDIIFYKCKLFDTYDILKDWCDETVMLFNEREKEDNSEDPFEKSNVSDSSIVDAMLLFIKSKYDNIGEYLFAPVHMTDIATTSNSLDITLYFITGEMFNYVAGY